MFSSANEDLTGEFSLACTFPLLLRFLLERRSRRWTTSQGEHGVWDNRLVSACGDTGSAYSSLIGESLIGESGGRELGGSVTFARHATHASSRATRLEAPIGSSSYMRPWTDPRWPNHADEDMFALSEGRRRSLSRARKAGILVSAEESMTQLDNAIVALMPQIRLAINSI